MNQQRPSSTGSQQKFFLLFVRPGGREESFLEKTVRVFGTPEEPLFLARDVAEWIDHSQPSVMLKAIDDDEKVKVNNLHFENRTGGNGTWFLTENGLYEVLMLSRKPKAKEFKKKVNSTIIGGGVPLNERRV